MWGWIYKWDSTFILLIIFSFLRFIFVIFGFVCVCLYIGICICIQMPIEKWTVCWVLWGWSYRWLLSTQYENWELNTDPLEKRPCNVGIMSNVTTEYVLVVWLFSVTDVWKKQIFIQDKEPIDKRNDSV